MGKFETFCEQYRGRFGYETGQVRMIGIEKEILAVDKDGMAADIPSKVWPHLLEAGFSPVFDGYYKDSVTGFMADGDQIALDAGKGTFEIIMCPQQNAHDAERRLKELLSILLPFCEKEGIRMISLGYQPRALPAKEIWNRKQRYEVLLDYFGEAVYPAGLSASDQVHVDVAENEIVAAINFMNGMAGFFVALFANCPVFEGPNNYKAFREVIWDGLGADRTGIPAKPVTSLEDYLSRVWDLTCVMAFDGEKYFAPGVKFRDYVEGFGMDDLFRAYAVHEGSVWFCARPRVYGTLEIRPAALQPWEDMVAVPALALGLMENHNESEMFVKQFRWDTLRTLRMDAVKKGFEAKLGRESVAPFVRQMLDIAGKGLESRGLGEEKYLDCLYARVEGEEAPVDAGRKYLKEGGMNLLLRNATLTAEHIKF